MASVLPPPSSTQREKWWRAFAGAALRREETPFYLFSAIPILEALNEIEWAADAAGFAARRTSSRSAPIVLRQWFSLKTQPLQPILQWWRSQGRPVEVVSAFELEAALAAGFSPDRVLVNGPAKHTWLPRLACDGLLVNVDSPTELPALVPLARRHHWTLGLRLNTQAEFDPERPDLPSPFGLDAAAARQVLRRLRRAGLQVEIAHFHLRTNLPTSQPHQQALAEVAAFCQAEKWYPRIVDVGGGLPPPFVRDRDGQLLQRRFNLAGWARMLANASRTFPGLEEMWLENGRFLTARSGALVLRIMDIKERRGIRQVLCDGGRTLHALVATWEQHDLLSLPRRVGTKTLTSIHGPTCMCFDQLGRLPLPRTLQVGDYLVWLDAGAYHLSWETQFSHGQIPVLWHDGKSLRRVRRRQAFADWWRRRGTA